jgi:aminomethyltransferase
MIQDTPLVHLHRELGARLVDFAGWNLPVQYSSLVEEHHAVRQAAGLFDVSHMGVVDLVGGDQTAFLRRVLTGDVLRIDPGRALYGCLCDERGGIIDDLITYRLDSDRYRLVINAATRVGDLQWLRSHAADFAVDVQERADLAMVAIQGPQARERVATIRPAWAETVRGLRRFAAAAVAEAFIARTGYTGEDGVEVILPAEQAIALYRDATAAGVVPCGLGARDSLRLEAGLNLYGQDMERTPTPLESNLGWTVSWHDADRDFIGREALAGQRQEGVERDLVGLVLAEKGVPRPGMAVLTDGGEGIVTSGGFSPTLERGIALARLPATAIKPGGSVQVQVRRRELAAIIHHPPFVRGGRSCVTDLPLTAD